ncbi:MAG TPA: tetratricopeptide repeat protein [Enhygromyxa sp.]|nr:tetratricopeptide repeat protein [Enhygromyxa sp.]
MSTQHEDPDEARWEQAAARLDESAALLADGRVGEALALARLCADELRAIVGPEHPDFANALALLGEIALTQGDVDDAAAQLEASLAILDRHMPEHDDIVAPMRPPVLDLLARTHTSVGRYEQAEALIRAAIGESERLGDALGLAVQTQTLGVLLRFAGRYDEAAEVYAASAELLEANGEPLGPEHFHNLAGLALARGDACSAEAHARQAIALRDDDDLFGLATDLCGLADALAEQGRADEAEQHYRRALDLYARSERPEHPEIAYALHNLADALTSLGRLDEAEAAYRESLTRKLATLGPNSPDEAGTRNNLAALLAERGRLAEARDQSALACAIVRDRLPPQHPIRVACETLASSFERL